MSPSPIRKLSLLVALLYVTPASAQVLNVPGSDAKLTPSVTGNSSLGNISSPNLFDGSMTVSVPVYSYATDAGDFGISLSFNTKGIKVDEIGSAIGTHWSLNAGGTITRVLKDAPDEMWDIKYQTTGSALLYPIVGRMFWYNLTPAQIADQQTHHFYHDGESDDFIVSVGKQSFTFNIGKGGQVFSHPHTNARVQMLRNGSPVTMPAELTIPDGDYATFSFVITDTDGNRYYFEPGRVQEKSYYDARLDALDEVARWAYISQWVVSKIILAGGAQITYNYVNASPGTAPVYQAFTAKEQTAAPQYDPRTGPVEQSGSSRDLSAIVYPNGVTASFIYHDGTTIGARCDNPGIRMLDRIRVGTPEKAVQYRFNHVYALSQGTTNPGGELALGSPCQTMNPAGLSSALGHRLRLKSIDILSDDGTVTEPYYSFGYNMSPMPRRLYGGQDYFGYANGLTLSETTFQQLLPYHPSPITGQYAGIDKGVNPEAIKAGNLVSVTNAYGGKSEFAYEAHQLSTVMSGLPDSDPLFIGKGQADGLRLKSITETDRFYPGNAKVTSFTYSDGQIFLDGGYFHFPVRTSGGGTVVNEYNIGGIYATAHQLINGSNHGYSQVTAEVKDQSGQLLSRKITKFSNFKDDNNTLRTYISGGGKNFYQYPYSDKQYIRDWEIGLPLYESVFDKNGRVTSQKTNFFRFTMDSSAKDYVYNTKKLETIPDNWNPNTYNPYYVYASDNYSPYTGKALLEKAVTLKYVSDNSYISDTVSYTYDSRNNLKTTLTRNSEGAYIQTEQVYNYEAMDNSSTGGLVTMTAGGLEKVVSIERWKLGTTGHLPANMSLLDASITGYDYDNGRLRVKSLYTRIAGSPLAYVDYTGITTPVPINARYNKVRLVYDGQLPSAFRKMSEVQLFDEKSNPLETRLLNQDKYKAMIWDTAGNKLADVTNARYNEIGYTGFENQPASGAVIDGRFSYSCDKISYSGGAISGKGAYNLGSPVNNTPVSISGLSPGKTYIISFWAKNGIPVFSPNSLTLVPFTALKSKGDWTYYEGRFSGPSNGTYTLSGSGPLYIDELRLYPSDAMMATATYDPFLGKTSSGDAAGRISYMEYDKLGRPMLVRDQEGNILSQTRYQVHP